MRKPPPQRGISRGKSAKNGLLVTAHFALQRKWKRNCLLGAECRTTLGWSISNQLSCCQSNSLHASKDVPVGSDPWRVIPNFHMSCWFLDGTIVGTGTTPFFFLCLACQICGKARHNFAGQFTHEMNLLSVAISGKSMPTPWYYSILGDMLIRECLNRGSPFLIPS